MCWCAIKKLLTHSNNTNSKLLLNVLGVKPDSKWWVDTEATNCRQQSVVAAAFLDRVKAFSADISVFVGMWCWYGYVCAISTADNVGKSSNAMEIVDDYTLIRGRMYVVGCFGTQYRGHCSDTVWHQWVANAVHIASDALHSCILPVA